MLLGGVGCADADVAEGGGAGEVVAWKLGVRLAVGGVEDRGDGADVGGVVVFEEVSVAGAGVVDVDDSVVVLQDVGVCADAPSVGRAGVGVDDDGSGAVVGQPVADGGVAVEPP